MEMKELLLCVDTVKKSDRIVQMGTQVRSLPSSMAARKFVTGGGLGKVFKVEQERNSIKPYWHSYGEREFLTEEEVKVIADRMAAAAARGATTANADAAA